MHPDLEIIADWIRPGSRTLDLGCGDGTLLHHLKERRNTWGVGMEINDDDIVKCIRKGVNVIKSDLNAGLRTYFSENTFDYVIMTQTLQEIRRPANLLDEMLRIGSVGVVTFPNMGHWHCRWQLARGAMPMTRALPSAWYETDNVQLCTLTDFESLCTDKGMHIRQRALLDWSGGRRNWLSRLSPNLFAETAIYMLSYEKTDTL